jgi:hypothetical protein
MVPAAALQCRLNSRSPEQGLPMTRRVFLHLEALENRLTPATIRPVPVIVSSALHHPVVTTAKVVNQSPVRQITGGQVVRVVGVLPAIGASLGEGGNGGSSGGGGIGGTTGDPAG